MPTYQAAGERRAIMMVTHGPGYAHTCHDAIENDERVSHQLAVRAALRQISKCRGRRQHEYSSPLAVISITIIRRYWRRLIFTQAFFCRLSCTASASPRTPITL